MADQQAWAKAHYTIQLNTGETHIIAVSGRDRWALEQLIAAGNQGCTPIDNPAPRWAGYAFNLRNMSVEIETLHEKHQGPFPGTHGRYVLRSKVSRLGSDEATS